jgi:hypothetical protein
LCVREIVKEGRISESLMKIMCDWIKLISKVLVNLRHKIDRSWTQIPLNM